MLFPPCVVEALIGDTLILPLAVHDKQGRLFDDCQHLDIQWILQNPQIFERNPGLIFVGSVNNTDRSDGSVRGPKNLRGKNGIKKSCS